jgi:thiosulfate/3-mercaptopyruvate sulfurtransferase
MIKKASWLMKNLDKKNIKIIDASWYLPNSGRDAYKEYSKNHIKNAVFFDIDKISDKKTSLPHMLPPIKKFEMEVSKLGINRDDILIIYCKEGLTSSPRVWWTFVYFGHKKVFILDGGLNAWKLIGGQLTKINYKIKKSNYKCGLKKKKLIINYLSLKNNLNTKNNEIVLDARPEKRFLKIESEPRKNIGKGNIPGSINYPIIYFDKKGFLKSKMEIRKILKNITNKNKKIICSCGSGVAACNIALSLEYIGHHNWAVYDGSWTEWYLKESIQFL